MTKFQENEIHICNLKAELNGTTNPQMLEDIRRELDALYEEQLLLGGDCVNTGNCSVSTGIHEGLTFGSGELDRYGFWEKPCYHCARAHELNHPERNDENWPYADSRYTSPEHIIPKNKS